MTPEESWSHVKPYVSTFRVFGSASWALIPNEKRKALEKKSQPLIFVGYCEDMKAYRLFDPITKDVLFHRVVHFDENFQHSSEPSLSTVCHDGADLVDNLILEDHEENENPPPEDGNQFAEHPPLTVDQPIEDHHDQDQVRRSFRQRQRPDRYGYDVFDFSYFAPASTNI